MISRGAGDVHQVVVLGDADGGVDAQADGRGAFR